MFNAIPKQNSNFPLIIPSSKHFSILINNPTVYNIFLVSFLVFIVASNIMNIPFAGFVSFGAAVLAAYRVFTSYRKDKIDLVWLYGVEKAFNRMPKVERQRYAKHLEHCYKDGKNRVLMNHAQDLFSEFAVDPTSNIVSQEIREELDRVRAGKKLAAEIYRESMGDKNA